MSGLGGTLSQQLLRVSLESRMGAKQKSQKDRANTVKRRGLRSVFLKLGVQVFSSLRTNRMF